MPSRSTQRLAACRTRLSSHGEPSAKENCHGHTCGCALAVMTKPRCLICGSASGAGASIQSTWPDSSAAVRALGSGIGSSTSRSSFGTLFLSQYSANFTSSSRSRGTNLSILNGPLPEAFAAKAVHACLARSFGSVTPAGTASNSFCQCAGLAMNRLVRLIGRNASGCAVVSSTVSSSTLRAERRVGMREAVTPTWLASKWIASCFSTFSTFHTTASALKAEPSWNLTPGPQLEHPFRLVVRIDGPLRRQAGDHDARLVGRGQVPLGQGVVHRNAGKPVPFESLVGLAERARDVRGGHADAQRALRLRDGWGIAHGEHGCRKCAKNESRFIAHGASRIDAIGSMRNDPRSRWSNRCATEPPAESKPGRRRPIAFCLRFQLPAGLIITPICCAWQSCD